MTNRVTNAVLRLSTITLVAIVVGCTDGVVRRDDHTVASRSASGNILVKMRSESYVIRVGDNIDMSVWGYPEFNTSTTVKAGGAILIPLVGEMKVAGLTKDEFGAQLKTRLAEYVQGELRISLSVSSAVIQRVSVMGAVTRQDNYPVTADVSIVEILSTAGGAMEDSDLHHVRIIRFGGEDPVEVDVASHLESGEVDLMPKVRPGDTVYVPKKENFIRSFSDFLRDVILLFGFFRVLG